jgi:hypothetical protein
VRWGLGAMGDERDGGRNYTTVWRSEGGRAKMT